MPILSHRMIFFKKNKYKDAINIYSDNSLTSYSVNRNLCIRVRRDDNTELDIGFVSGIRDDAAILTFAGAGGNAWICVRYSQISSALDIVIAVAADQQKICNAGEIVSYTAKYNCFEPWQSAISLNDANGLLAVNGRMNNLSAASYVVFKDSRSTNLNGYTADYVFPMKMTANSLNDSSNNGLNVFYYFRDGTTSILARPSITCVPAGVDYMFCMDMCANDTVTIRTFNTAFNFIGSTMDLPKAYRFIVDWTNISGPLNVFRHDVILINLSGNSFLNTDISLLPVIQHTLDLSNSGVSGILTGQSFCVAINLNNTNMSANDTDQTLINLNDITTVVGAISYVNNRTALSDGAVAALLAKGWTLTPV